MNYETLYPVLPTPDGYLLTADDIGERLHIRPDTIRQWSYRKHLSPVKLSGISFYNPFAVVARAIQRGML